jgi:hypothetical protein
MYDKNEIRFWMKSKFSEDESGFRMGKNHVSDKRKQVLNGRNRDPQRD